MRDCPERFQQNFDGLSSWLPPLSAMGVGGVGEKAKNAALLLHSGIYAFKKTRAGGGRNVV